MSIIYALDLIGTFVFAISGTLAAREKSMDIFGASILAFVTAIGGGTIRDVLIGKTPVGWMMDLNYLIVIGLAILSVLLFRKLIQRLRRTMFLFDTIGLGLFTILGMKATLNVGLSPVIAIMMGTTSAAFGGVVRDVLSNEIPLIFRKEIYATACIIGGLVFWLGLRLGFSEYPMIFITILLVIAIRVIAVVKKFRLPGLGPEG